MFPLVAISKHTRDHLDFTAAIQEVNVEKAILVSRGLATFLWKGSTIAAGALTTSRVDALAFGTTDTSLVGAATSLAIPATASGLSIPFIKGDSAKQQAFQ